MSFKTRILSAGYRRVVKPIFFKIDPERMHDSAMRAGDRLGRFTVCKKIIRVLLYNHFKELEQTVFGIDFDNPIGLSAGFDKDANLVNVLDDVGFGYMQVGTVTLNPYEGNPPPRLYRLPKSKGLVVYFGLKSLGIHKVVERLKTAKAKLPLSISIGKTNCDATASTEAGIQDYYGCLKHVIEEGVGDMYTLNISCPNTFGGEPFTSPEKLERLLQRVRELKIDKPLLLKMPINSDWENFQGLLDVSMEYGVDGVIIGNLNKDHQDPAVKDTIPEYVKGGIGGRPTWELSNDLISRTCKYCGDRMIIVGVGGVFNAQDAYEKIKRGATLVQLITGMVYEGPQLIGEIKEGLVRLLRKDGYENIGDAVGSMHKE